MAFEANSCKTAAVKKFPIPTNPIEMKSFRRECFYYRRFHENFAHTVRPLHKTNEVTVNFKWTPEAQNDSETLKSRLTITADLAFPLMKKLFIFNMGAKIIAIGDFFCQ